METSDRLGLPLLSSGQAAKEMTHNEALAMLDLAVQAVVQQRLDAPPAAPAPGQCWAVGAGAGAWSGHGGAIAAWTGSGWRFVAPSAGMRAWSLADGCELRSTGIGWIDALDAAKLRIGGQQVVGPRSTAVAPPSGGTTVDVQARAAITALLDRLVLHGLIAA